MEKRGRLKKTIHVLFAIFVLTRGFAIAQSQTDSTSLSVDTLVPGEAVITPEPAGLDDAYTLGRIPSQILSDYLTDYANINSQGLFLTTFRHQIGKTGNGSFSVTPLLMATDGDFTAWSFVPELDWAFRPSASNRCKISVMPLNFVTTSSPYGNASGFDIPLTIINKYQWSFLTKGGAITVPRDQYDLSFLFGPHLNAGQLRNDVSITHTINGDTVPLRIFAATTSPKLGISDNISLCADAHYGFYDSASGYTTTYSGGVTTKSYDKYSNDSLSVVFNINARFIGFFAEAGVSYDWWRKRWCNSDYTLWTSGNTSPGLYGRILNRTSDRLGINGLVGFLSGGRIDRIGQVAGNWDGLYSNVLGKGQLLTILGATVFPPYTATYAASDSIGGLEHSIDSTLHETEFFQKTQWGFLDHFTVGDQLSGLLRSEPAAYTCLVELAANTIAPRDYGPAQATNQEYFQGRRLHCSEMFGAIRYKLPFFKRDMPYSYSSILNATGGLTGLAGINKIGGSPVEIFDWTAPTNRTMLSTPDIALQCAWGVADWCTFTFDFEFDKTNFIVTPRPPETSGGIYFSFNQVASRSFSTDLAMVTFHFDDKRRLSLAWVIANQSIHYDPAQTSDTRTFQIMGIYQTALPYGSVFKKRDDQK